MSEEEIPDNNVKITYNKDGTPRKQLSQESLDKLAKARQANKLAKARQVAESLENLAKERQLARARQAQEKNQTINIKIEKIEIMIEKK
jgi:hypothetical protein